MYYVCIDIRNCYTNRAYGDQVDLPSILESKCPGNVNMISNLLKMRVKHYARTVQINKNHTGVEPEGCASGQGH
jgi:hypothetical protein